MLLHVFMLLWMVSFLTEVQSTDQTGVHEAAANGCHCHAGISCLTPVHKTAQTDVLEVAVSIVPCGLQAKLDRDHKTSKGLASKVGVVKRHVAYKTKP